MDAVEGTTLYDGIVKSARSFVGETNSGRVVIVVTDGNETRSTATLESAIHAAREAGVLVYVVAIESRQFNPAPLRPAIRAVAIAEPDRAASSATCTRESPQSSGARGASST